MVNQFYYYRSLLTNLQSSKDIIYFTLYIFYYVLVSQKCKLKDPMIFYKNEHNIEVDNVINIFKNTLNDFLHIDIFLYEYQNMFNCLKTIKKIICNTNNAYILCNGGLGDLFIMCGAIRFLSYFYNKIYLFCPLSSLKNLEILFFDINIEFIPYDKWYNESINNFTFSTINKSWHTVAYKFLIDESYNNFDWLRYVNYYSDLREKLQNSEDAWHHWVNYGKNEGRMYFKYEQMDSFDWIKYINFYYDIQDEIKTMHDAWYHWINYGKNEGRIYFEYEQFDNFEMFDWIKYINFYNDIKEQITTKEDAWEHWINYGKNEGRIYFEYEHFDSFDWIKYINFYNDIKQQITNRQDAWSHWISYGKNEGRIYFRNSFNSKNNENKCKDNDDIFIVGNHFLNMTSKVTNNAFVDFTNQHKSNNKYPNPYYDHIAIFYSKMNLDISIYYDYFYLPSTAKSQRLYQEIQNYKIVFLHFVSSCGESYIPHQEWPHIYEEEYLIINPDKNHYNPEESPVKYNLANNYLGLLVTDYIDIILNSTDIYVCDSCFANIVYPLRITDKLKATNVIIYDRFYPNSFHAFPNPINLSR